MKTNISNHLQVTCLRYYVNNLTHLDKQHTPVKVALGAEKILETFSLLPFFFISKNKSMRQISLILLLHFILSASQNKAIRIRTP